MAETISRWRWRWLNKRAAFAVFAATKLQAMKYKRTEEVKEDSDKQAKMLANFISWKRG